MKILFKLLLPILFLTSCSARITSRRFALIQPEREWEVTLTLKEDSTFILKDDFGCNKFYYSGKWQYLNSSAAFKVILSDTLKAEFVRSYGAYKVYNRNINSEELYLPNRYFPVISRDTITFNKNKTEIFFRHLVFKKQTVFNRKNLSKTSASILARMLVNGTKLSNMDFKKMFGKSKRKMIKEKTKQYMICHPTEIPMKMGPL